MKRHTVSFKYAVEGFFIAIKTQVNFRIHLLLSSLAVLIGLGLSLSPVEWAVVFLTISAGLAVELLNTAIEFAVDLVTTEHHQLAKYAKDCAAAAMLVYSIGACVVAAVIFVPKFIGVL